MVAKKKGWPKTNVREKSVVDLIEELAKKKQTRRKKFYCRICQKFNHNMADCFQNPANWQSTLEEEANDLDKDGQEGKAWGL